MSHRALLRVAAAALILSAAGCAADDEEPGDPFAASLPTASPTPPLEPSPTSGGAEAEEDGGSESGGGSGQGGVDCAAYADSDDWCENGIGDYDCDGGPGNGPNYAPEGVEVIQPGEDPFGLDRNNDGEGCEVQAPAPPPPPAEPDTDPRFDTCGEAIDNGYGPYYRGTDPEYDWYRDADSDGVVCE